MAKTRTPEQEQATKDALFQISARVFLRDGYAETSMKTLAEEAGCTTGKFYSNFSGKQEILSMLMSNLLKKNCEEAVRYADKTGDACFGMAVFYALIYRGSSLYENLREIYCEGLGIQETKQVAEQMSAEIIQAASKRNDSEQYEDFQNPEMKLALKTAVSAIPTLLLNIHTIAEEQREQVFMCTLLRILSRDEETCLDIIKRVRKEDSHIRDKAYDVMVKLLEGRKRRR